jgi:hypothetical protein
MTLDELIDEYKNTGNIIKKLEEINHDLYSTGKNIYNKVFTNLKRDCECTDLFSDWFKTKSTHISNKIKVLEYEKLKIYNRIRNIILPQMNKMFLETIDSNEIKKILE